MMASLENPFPAKAVTTFGGPNQDYAEFGYMRRVHDVLVEYLGSYPGGAAPALALSGGHGTGKTSLLSWLAGVAAGMQRAKARAIYAKTDNPNLVEVYRNLLRNFTRRELLDVVGEALKRQGLSRVQEVAATVSEGDIIEETGSMESAFEGKLLDPNELHLELRRTLEGRSVSSQVSRRIAFAIGLLEDTQYGEPAFEWLAGQPSDIPDEALKSPLFPPEEDGAQTAVDALETLAALFKEANMPLVVLLDQVENFVPREQAAASSSVLKKIAEQLGAQSAMVIMAGTPRAWENLPRDMWPRFHGRAPLPVGSLDVTETEVLLSTYLQGQQLFAPPIVALVNDLSGGNSREILQIGHQAWEISAGNLSSLSNEQVSEAAKRAGTLEDRGELAQQVLRDIAADQSLSLWRVREGADGAPAWIVENSSGARAAIIIAMATDARSESHLAQQITSLTREFQSSGEASEIIAVTVGYSSEKVQSLLTGISRTIVFREEDFAARLQSELAATLMSAPPRTDPTAKFDEQFAKLESALVEVQRVREETEKRTAELLARQSESLATSARQERQATTRLQLREGLDNLSEALSAGNAGAERAVLRELLIGNEAYLKNDDLDYLGNIYLDLLDIQNALDLPSVQSTEAQGQAFRLRLSVIARLRRVLIESQHGMSRVLLTRIATAVVGVVTALIVYLYIDERFVRYAYIGGQETLVGPSAVQVLMMAMISGVLAAGIIYLFFDILSRPTFRYRSLRASVARLRHE